MALLIPPPPALASPNGVLISEFRFRGPSGGNDEFVELKNTSAEARDISGYKLQGCSGTATATPSTRATVPAGVTLPPGGSYLFTNNGSNGYSGVVIGDQTYSTGTSDTGGIVLADGGTGVIDKVGATATSEACKEGAGIAGIPTVNGDNSYERKAGGTQDTDDNAADFEGPKAGDPQNGGGTPPTPACSDGVDNDNDGKVDFGGANPDPGCTSASDNDETDPPVPTVTKIGAVQGPGPSSPLTNQTVTVEGVVTGIDDEIGASFGSGNTIRRFPEDAGIFVQEEAADEDSDPNTSEGVFVGFVTDRKAYQPGDVVRVNGRVTEKFGQTQINETIDQEPTKTGTAPVPEPVVIDEARAEGQDAGARPYYESLEGMRVELAEGTANSGGTNKFNELFLTPGPEKDRVFRGENVPALIAADSDAGAGDPDNPFRDPDGSTTRVNGDLFDTVNGAVGPVSFGFENYRIVVQPGNLPTVADTGVTYPYDELVPAAGDEVRVASFNVENYFPEGGALDGATVSAGESAEKRARIADAIDNLLERPDVMALQEIGDSPATTSLQNLRALADTLNEGRPADERYTPYLEEGNDTRGIDVGFLIKGTVEATDVRQLGKDAPGPAGIRCSDVEGGLFDRPPLFADITTPGGKRFTVVSNHFSSKAAPDECRTAQAAFVRDRVEEIEAGGGQAIVAGDLNAFEDESALATLQDGKTTLTNQRFRAPEEEAYSFQFGGRLQTLDHALLTDGLDPLVRDFRYAHIDNDYHEREEDVATPDATPAETADGHKVSDHDPPVLTLADEPLDRIGPVVYPLSPDPGSSTRDRTPAVRAIVRDARTDLTKSDIKLFLDGREVPVFTYDRAANRLTYVPPRDLSIGPHYVRLAARDAGGNVTVRQWSFRVR